MDRPSEKDASGPMATNSAGAGGEERGLRLSRASTAAATAAPDRTRLSVDESSLGGMGGPIACRPC